MRTLSQRRRLARLLASIAALGLVFTMTACGSTNSNGSNSSSTSRSGY